MNNEIKAKAIEFAKKNKKAIAKRLTNTAIYTPEKRPVSVFMAGSPGAGKTEASIALIEDAKMKGVNVLRIDPDELRNEFEDYTGDNSWLFQAGVSILVEKVHDLALKQKQSFILDGTLTKYDVAIRNIERSINKGRIVQILYVYQEPLLAWKFVQAREKVEGRNIRPDDFIEQYFKARDVVNKLKRDLKGGITIDLLLKNNDGSNRAYKSNIDNIDKHKPEKYSREDIEKMLQ